VIETFLDALVALLVIIDPTGTSALFLGMTPGNTTAERAAQARKACLIALVVLTIFGLAGEELLRAMGIGLPAMKVAGGILLFLTAASMVSTSTLRAAPEGDTASRAAVDISVFPLAIPFIAGPGAMTSIVLLQSRAGSDWSRVIGVEAALVAAIGITLVALLTARHVTRLLGKTGANVIGRVLGVLLAALAAQITLDGVRQFLAGS
jgi:multiple antibiotic resistance protein